MKNLKSLLFSAVGLLCSTSMSAHDFEVDGIYYNIMSPEDKTVEVTFSGDSYDAVENEYSGFVTIPETVTYNDNIYSVNSIGSFAFAGCSALTSVEIPNSVTCFRSLAFEGCSGLTSIVIPNSVTDIFNQVFSGCSGLTSVVIPNSVTSIGDAVFSGCSSLTSVEIPNSVTSIDHAAFSGCSNLTSVEIPNSVTSIGASVFQRCSSLTSVVIPNSVTKVGEYAFAGCSDLTSVIISNRMNSIDNCTFDGCTSLTSVVIPKSVTSIGSNAFDGCTSLTSVEIPNSVTSIGNYAFDGCSSLTSVVIPNSVTSIGINAFRQCSRLTSIVVAENNPTYDSRDNCNAIIETQTNTLIAGCSNTTIPNSVTSIGNYAFMLCESLTSVEIPNSVTIIGSEAFEYCSSLTSVEIPNSVTSIGVYAFSGTAWYNNQPDGVVYLDTYLLGYKGTMPSNTSIKIKEGTYLIADCAFFDCSSLTSVEIPNSVTIIGKQAFYECSGLTSVEIPNSVTSIGYYAFEGCSGLTSVEIPNSVTSIGDGAFAYCNSLTSITSYIPANKLFEINNYVFEGIDKTNCTLYVPYGAQETYAATAGWSDFTNIVEMPASITVSSAGYATLYLDYAAKIPEGVEVYAASEIEGDRLMMDLVEDVLPANTGVLVKAPAGTYTFNYNETEVPAIADNLFSGSVTAEYIDVPSNKTAFVLSSVDGNVGMYLAQLTDGQFLNNANKAYLLLSKDKLGISEDEVDTSIGGMQLSLRFDFNGSTGIDGVQTEINTQGAIYDLYGRKLQIATTPGLYIINGKKIWVK